MVDFDRLENRYKELEKKMDKKWKEDKELLEKKHFDKNLQRKLMSEYNKLLDEKLRIEKVIKPVEVNKFTRIRNGKKETIDGYRRRTPKKRKK